MSLLDSNNSDLQDIINEGDLFFKKSNNEEIMIYSDSYLSALSIHQNEILLGTSFGLTFVNMGSNLSRSRV